MIIFRFSATLALAILASCSDKISDEGLICSETPGFITSAATNSSEQIEITKQCIHKWGYRLSRAPGSNLEISKAVIGACRESIDHALGMMVEEGNKAKEPFTDAVWQLWVKQFEEEALFRVVQGRAGNCSIRGIDQK